MADNPTDWKVVTIRDFVSIFEASEQFLSAIRLLPPHRDSPPSDPRFRPLGKAGLMTFFSAIQALETRLHPLRLPLSGIYCSCPGGPIGVGRALRLLDDEFDRLLSRWHLRGSAGRPGCEAERGSRFCPITITSSDIDMIARIVEEMRRLRDDWFTAVSGAEPAPAAAGAEPPAVRQSLPEAPEDPVEQAAALIHSSDETVRLIRFLNGRAGRKAHLDDIAVELDKTPRISARKRRSTIRQRFNRARILLEQKGAPVRLLIEKQVVEMVIVASPPERATPV